MFINQINVNGTDYDIIPTGSELPLIVQIADSSLGMTEEGMAEKYGGSYTRIEPTFFLRNDNTVVLAY